MSVDEVLPGSEDRLRHFLESVVQQANANYPPPEAEAEEGTEAEADQDQPSDTSDAQMTERFRSFTEPAQSDS